MERGEVTESGCTFFSGPSVSYAKSYINCAPVWFKELVYGNAWHDPGDSIVIDEDAIWRGIQERKRKRRKK